MKHKPSLRGRHKRILFSGLFLTLSVLFSFRPCFAADPAPGGNVQQIEVTVIHVDQYAVYGPKLIFYFDPQMDKRKISSMTRTADQLRNRKAVITYLSKSEPGQDKRTVLLDISPVSERYSAEKPHYGSPGPAEDTYAKAPGPDKPPGYGAPDRQQHSYQAVPESKPTQPAVPPSSFEPPPPSRQPAGQDKRPAMQSPAQDQYPPVQGAGRERAAVQPVAPPSSFEPPPPSRQPVGQDKRPAMQSPAQEQYSPAQSTGRERAAVQPVAPPSSFEPPPPARQPAGQDKRPVPAVGQTVPSGQAPSNQAAVQDRKPPAAAAQAASITRDEITGFVRRILDLNGRKDLPAIMPLYAEKVDYYDRGVVSNDYVRRDLIYYFRNWDQITTTLDGDVVMIVLEPEVRIAKFVTSYSVKNTKKALTGKTENIWKIQRINGQLRLVDVKQKIFRGSSGQ